MNKIITYRIILYFYIFITILLLSDILLMSGGYSFRGYYTDKVIAWLWLIGTILCIFRFWNKKIIKIFFIVLTILIFLSILPMAMPLIALYGFLTGSADFQQIELSEQYRMERKTPNPLSLPQIEIYKKEGILEKKVAGIKYSYILSTLDDKLNVNYDSVNYAFTDDITTPITQAKIEKITTDSIKLRFEIKNENFSYNIPLINDYENKN